MGRTFLRLPDSRVDESFEVLRRVAAELESRGQKQRISKITRQSYDRWQAERANYVVTDDDAIIGLVTLNRETLSDWPDHLGLGPVCMLRGLATHPDYWGTGVGSLAVREVMRYANDRYVFLDCVSHRLPDFYRSLGFESIGRQTLTDRDDDRYDVTLMRIDLSVGNESGVD